MVHSAHFSESVLLVQGGNGVTTHGSGGEELLLLLLRHVCNPISTPNREDKLRNVRTSGKGNRTLASTERAGEEEV